MSIISNQKQQHKCILHELGHHLKHTDKYGENCIDAYENEVDKLLPYLALPTRYFIDDLIVCEDKIDMSEIADKYNRTEDVVENRILRFFTNYPL